MYCDFRLYSRVGYFEFFPFWIYFLEISQWKVTTKATQNVQQYRSKQQQHKINMFKSIKTYKRFIKFHSILFRERATLLKAHSLESRYFKFRCEFYLENRFYTHSRIMPILIKCFTSDRCIRGCSSRKMRKSWA